MTQQRARASKEERKARVPVGGRRTKLQISDLDLKRHHQGYVLRWFNDIGGRIHEALAGGWEYVMPEHAESLGQGAVHESNSDLGSVVSKVVDKRQGTRAYLMRITEEFYAEDQAAKEEQNSLVDQALRPAEQGGQTIEQGYTPRA